MRSSFNSPCRLIGSCLTSRVFKTFVSCSLMMFAVFALYTYSHVLKAKTTSGIILTPADCCHLGFLWYDVGNHPEVQKHLHWTTVSLLKHSTVPLHFHVLTTSLNEDFALARDIITAVAREMGREIPQVSNVNATEFIEGHREKVGHIKSLISKPGLKFHLDMNALYPLTPEILVDLPEIIMMDTDLRFIEDIRYLFEEFSRFPASALVGCAPELNPSFYINLAKYRQENPHTLLGGTEPKHMQGLNTGVLMLKLDGLRNSAAYGYRVSPNGSSELFTEYRFDWERPWQAGHQDFFTLLSYAHPEMFHFLGCGWNRNICVREWFSKGPVQVPNFSKYFTCMEKTRVVHANCEVPFPEEV